MYLLVERVGWADPAGRLGEGGFFSGLPYLLCSLSECVDGGEGFVVGALGGDTIQFHSELLGVNPRCNGYQLPGDCMY